MKKKTALLIIGIVFLAYANTLFNDFIGDDRSIFLENNFYANPGNLPRLFQKSFITTFEDIDPAANKQPSFSGCVSYRPAVSLSFFFDHFLWGTNAAGYHLSNLMLHLLAVFLVYFSVQRIIENHALALFASLLFAIHPINAEAVNNIGYRSDLLLVIFYLAAFLSFVKSRTGGRDAGKQPLVASYVFFAAALLSKESAVTLPLILLAYDTLFPPGGGKNRFISLLKERKFEYMTFFLILLAYLYIYLFVFPNSNHPRLFDFQVDWFARLKTVVGIFYRYLLVFFLPFKVTVLPPLYMPPLALKGFEVFPVIFFLILCVIVISKFWKKERGVSFFTLWFLATYIPAANLILLPNPFAFRFLYLPSIGFFAVAAVLLSKGFTLLSRRTKIGNLKALLQFTVLSACLFVTVPYNFFYRNEFIACSEMIRNYPESSRPYWNLGRIYFKKGEYTKASENFKTYLSKDKNNPFVTVMDWDVHYFLGLCQWDRPEKAMEEFEKAVRFNPGFAAPYTGMARIHIREKNYKKGLENSLKSISLNPASPEGYALAVYCRMKLGEIKEAKALLGAALKLSPGDPHLQYLQKETEKNERP